MCQVLTTWQALWELTHLIPQITLEGRQADEPHFTTEGDAPDDIA